MSGSSSTLILVLGKREEENSALVPMTSHAIYQLKACEIFLAACQFSWPFHILALSVCTKGLGEAPRDIVAQHRGAKGFQEAVEDWPYSNSAGIFGFDHLMCS